MQGRYDISTLTCSFFAAPSHRRRLLFRLLRFSSSGRKHRKRRKRRNASPSSSGGDSLDSASEAGDSSSSRYDISTLTCSFFAAPSHRRRLLFRLLRFSSSDELGQARAATALTALARRETPAQVAEMVVALAHRKTSRRLRCFRRAGAA
jgi:hypothetical protein